MKQNHGLLQTLLPIIILENKNFMHMQMKVKTRIVIREKNKLQTTKHFRNWGKTLHF